MNTKICDDILIIYLTGDIDQHVVSNMRSEIDLTIRQNNIKNIIFDFKEVEFMDSSGLGMILSRYKSLQQTDGEIMLSNVSDNTMRLFDMVGIKKIIKIYDTVEDCISSLVEV